MAEWLKALAWKAGKPSQGVSGVRIPLSPPFWYIPGTSLTLHSGHIVYTFEAYISSQKEKRYALEGNLCDG